MSSLVLIVDPDGVERRYIAAVLAGEGLDITQVDSPIKGIVEAMEKSEDVAVIVLAEETAPVHVADVIQVIRKVVSAPLLVVGNDGSSELASLDSGADAYMPRPFSASGLIARVNMLTRRAGGGAEPNITKLDELRSTRRRLLIEIDQFGQPSRSIDPTGRYANRGA